MAARTRSGPVCGFRSGIGARPLLLLLLLLALALPLPPGLPGAVQPEHPWAALAQPRRGAPAAGQGDLGRPAPAVAQRETAQVPDPAPAVDPEPHQPSTSSGSTRAPQPARALHLSVPRLGTPSARVPHRQVPTRTSCWAG